MLRGLAVLSLLALSACVARPRMCTAAMDCGAQAACVAGRCQSDRGTPTIVTARRVIAAPVDVAYVRRGDGARRGTTPSVFTLGRDDGAAVLYLRFAVALPRDASVVEAYVLLDRSSDRVDDDPAPIPLHAARIVDDWDGRSISWGRSPRLSDGRSPTTMVLPTGPRLVRVDVRELVRRWPLHERDEHGIAILAERTSSTGMSFAFFPAGATGHAEFFLASNAPPVSAGGASAAMVPGAEARETHPAVAVSAGPTHGAGADLTGAPRLELYLK